MGSSREWQTNMDTVVTILEVRCASLNLALSCRIGKSVFCMRNLLLESQGEKRKSAHWAGHDETACLGGSAGGC